MKQHAKGEKKDAGCRFILSCGRFLLSLSFDTKMID